MCQSSDKMPVNARRVTKRSIQSDKKGLGVIGYSPRAPSHTRPIRFLFNRPPYPVSPSSPSSPSPRRSLPLLRSLLDALAALPRSCSHPGSRWHKRCLLGYHLRPKRQSRRFARTEGDRRERHLAVSGFKRCHFLAFPDFLHTLARPPPIEVNTTDTLRVHATNSLDRPTTLHHHGMFFNSTSWYDGATGVTQW